MTTTEMSWFPVACDENDDSNRRISPKEEAAERNAAFRRAVHALSRHVGKRSGRDADGRMIFLDAREELCLIADWQERAHRPSLDRLVLSHMPLVMRMAKNVCDGAVASCDIDPADLIQDGVLGLIRAVERFKPSEETRLATLAAYHIAGRMKTLLMSAGRPMRLGTNFNERRALAQITTARRSFFAETGRNPGVQDAERLGEMMGVPPSHAKRAMMLNAGMSVPLNRVEIISGAPDEVSRITQGDLTAILSRAVSNATKMMTHRDRKIIKEVVILEMSGDAADGMKTIAKNIGLTVERVRQIRRCGLSLIRAELERIGITPPVLFGAA